MTKTFLLKMKIKSFLKGDHWVYIKTPQNNVRLSAIQVAKNEELVITDDYKIVVKKTPYFVKDWKWKLYELFFK